MPAQSSFETSDADPASSLHAKFSQPQFDPIDFLNDVLPPVNLSTQTQAQPQKTARSTQIQSASTESLALFSSLNTVNIRASADLTALTDEIIRSGNRLAYEVEVLRGDVNSLHELLTESLREDIEHFVQRELGDGTNVSSVSEGQEATVAEAQQHNNEPDFMTQLRLLGKVKARLETVVATFGEAMKWPMPPSELSMASSLISVSSPELGIQNTEEDDKAREILRRIRAEIKELLDSEGGDLTGLEAASRKMGDYRQLALLWKGTGEEKARAKFVDSLAKMVEDRRKTVDGRQMPRNARTDGLHRPASTMGRYSKASTEGGGAAGLFRNLQRLKDDLYLE